MDNTLTRRPCFVLFLVTAFLMCVGFDWGCDATLVPEAEDNPP